MSRSSSESKSERAGFRQDASRFVLVEQARSESHLPLQRSIYSPPISPPRRPSYVEALTTLQPMRASFSSNSSAEGTGRVKAGQLWQDESPKHSPRSPTRSLAEGNAYKQPSPKSPARVLGDSNSRRPPLSPPLPLARATPPASPARSTPISPSRSTPVTPTRSSYTAPNVPPKSSKRPGTSPQRTSFSPVIVEPLPVKASPPASPSSPTYQTAPNTLVRSRKGKQRVPRDLDIWDTTTSDASVEEEEAGASSSSATFEEDKTRGSILFGTPRSPTRTIKQDWPVDVSPSELKTSLRRSQSAQPNLEEQTSKMNGRPKHASMAQILDEQADAYNEDMPIADKEIERQRSASPLQRHRRVSSHDSHRTPNHRNRYRRASRSDSVVSTSSIAKPRLSPPLAMTGFNLGDFPDKPPSPSIQRRISSLHAGSSRDSMSVASSPPSEAMESIASSSKAGSSRYATPESTPSLRPRRSEDLSEALEIETPSLARVEEEKRGRIRARAIQELISTEWTYAQDLAVARDVYYARAQGVPLSEIAAHLSSSSDFVPPPTPAMQAHSFTPLSPDLSRRSFAPSPALTSVGTFSPRSSIGPPTPAPANPAPPPMSAKDIKAIFLNLSDVAAFGSAFSGLLDAAAGLAMQSGTSGDDDRIGEEFLRMMPRIASVYSTYCSRHGSALARLEELESTLTGYLTECQELCQSLTHSWSLGSLLIKPVQRCLKYPLLIETILNNTLPSHPDYHNLESALAKMLAVAQDLNEAKRRNDLVNRAIKKKEKPRDKPRKSNSLTTSMSTASFTHTVSKKLLRSGYKVQRAAGLESPIDSDVEEAVLLETLVGHFEARRVDVDALGTDIRGWLSSWTMLLQRTRALLSAWVQTYEPLEGEAEIQGGGLDAIRAFFRLVETLEEEVLSQLSFRLHAKVFPALNRLDPLFEGPRLVIAKRNVKRADYERAVRHPGDRLAQEGRNAYLGLSRTLAAELPIFLAAISRAVDHIVYEVSHIQADFYQAQYGRLLAFERTYCSKFAGGGDVAEAWWQLVQPLHAAVDGLSCLNSTLLMHRIDGQRAAASSWRSSKASDVTDSSSSAPQRTQSAPGISLESLLLQSEKHQRHNTAEGGVSVKGLKSRRSTFWLRKSNRSSASTPPLNSPDELSSIRRFFANADSATTPPATPLLSANGSTPSLLQEPLSTKYYARALRSTKEGLLTDGRPTLSLRAGDHVAVLWEEGTGLTYVKDEVTGRSGYVPRDSVAALPAGAS